ncbi:hypothetical protein [Sphingobium sp. RAC03]|uniref:hypothetical protein n=1 Tax=Sphingobium sp. RAC03 TaxID=1843368 RepID=UPI00083E2093|nr:hypothetical protein [Sphingobium sp. RAC03]AOF97410.1 hypothetical protein BSY17_1608 [Sphingobium sp. RAC03]
MPASLIHSLERYDPPPDATSEALVGRLEALLILDGELREAGYAIHKDEYLYYAEVFPGIALYQILYESHEGIGRDMQLLLRLAIDRTVSTTMTELETVGAVGELGPWSEEGARSINALDRWIAVMREQLKTYQGDRDGFLLECLQAFPNFVFSQRFPDCLGTFNGNLNDFVAVIVSALISLADDMPECMEQTTTHACMKAFTAMSGYETSMEGDADRKDALTFQFECKDGTVRILCEPHIKLHCSARAGDAEYYFHRIYFSSAEHAEFEGKTLIGHIGEHL